jgi:hypothetical protein
MLDESDQLGSDLNPEYLPSEVVEWKDPQTGRRYLAKRYGDEKLFGKTYDKGIGSKMIQWVNALTSQAYVPNDPDAPFDPVTGKFIYKVDANNQPIVATDPQIAPDDPANVQCVENHACQAVRAYRGLLDYMRDTAARLGFPEPGLNGVYRP